VTLDTAPLAYDPFDPATHQNPYPAYRRLRDEDPVHVSPHGFWVLSRFDDVFQAALDTATFSSAQGLTFGDNEILTLGLKPTLVMMDRPEHTTFRRLISRGFTPRKVAELEPMMRDFVRTRVSIIAESDVGDFVEVLAGPLPTFVVALYLGVPESDRERFGAWSTAIVQANATGNAVRDAAEAIGGLYGYFTGLIDWRRQHPGDDMVSDLVAAKVDGQPLHVDEIPTSGASSSTTGPISSTPWRSCCASPARCRVCRARRPGTSRCTGHLSRPPRRSTCSTGLRIGILESSARRPRSST